MLDDLTVYDDLYHHISVKNNYRLPSVLNIFGNVNFDFVYQWLTVLKSIFAAILITLLFVCIQWPWLEFSLDVSFGLFFERVVHASRVSFGCNMTTLYPSFVRFVSH